MKCNLEIDLSEICSWDGESVATAIASEMMSQIKNKVRRELKADKNVDALVSRLKDATLRKMLKDLEEVGT